MRAWLAVFVFLAGCVNIPVPPTGENMGKYGNIEVRVQYKPNLSSMWPLDRLSVKGYTK